MDTLTEKLLGWVLVIPLLYYVGAFWFRLLRAAAVLAAKLAAGCRAERDSGPERGWEDEWKFERPGTPEPPSLYHERMPQ